MPPGQHHQHSRAGARELPPGTRPHGLGPRKTQALFRDLLTPLEARSPANGSTRLAGVVDHEKIHTANAVEPWRATQPRVSLLFWPT
jgi:hypothetical protein